MQQLILNNKKTVNAWCMYDWANSVYSLVITSAIFPVYYQAVAVAPDGSDRIRFFGFEVVNSVLYSYALSFSFLLVAVLLPVLSGIADYAGKKKYFMKLFVYLGSFSCMGLYLFTGNTIELGIVLCITASIGYSGSLVFYDAFLPEIVTSDHYDRTSARGYSWGYIGSVILMILCILMIEGYEVFGFPDKGIATRFSFLLVGVWWLGFSQISFYYLPDNVFNRQVKGSILWEGHRELLKVWRNLKRQAELKKYLFAFFFFNMGVQTVMYLAATFGAKELRLPAEKLILTVLLIQLVAAVGAVFFARLSGRRGNKFTLQLMIAMWILICLAAYFVTGEYQFYVLAFFVGLVMGGIQSLARATYSKMIPTSTIDHASYFSFYDVTYCLSIVFGTFSYGLIDQLTGSMRNSTLALMSYFIIGLVLLSITTIKPVKENINNEGA